MQSSSTSYRFRELHDGEQIIKVLHRNWFYLLEQFVLVILMAVVIFAGIATLPLLFPDLAEGEMKNLLFFAETTFFLVLWIWSFLIWIDYYFDIWIITSKRIINIEQKGLFMRNVSEADYTKIQDVTAEVHGFFPTIINFGDVYIQTAAETGRFVFRTISNPYGTKDLIMQLQRKRKARRMEDFSEMIHEHID